MCVCVCGWVDLLVSFWWIYWFPFRLSVDKSIAASSVQRVLPRHSHDDDICHYGHNLHPLRGPR